MIYQKKKTSLITPAVINLNIEEAFIGLETSSFLKIKLWHGVRTMCILKSIAMSKS